MSHPPDATRKNQLSREGEEGEGHQFFFTTGRKERFAQKKYIDHALQVGGTSVREFSLRKTNMLGNRRKKPCPDTRDNFFIIAYDQTMNSEKTRLRKSF